MAEANYTSGDDYVVEFLGYRFSFNGDDFEQRVTAAAVRLGLIGGNELEHEEISDLVELAADGVIEEPRSTLGRYVVRHWERISLVEGESLVYWLRKLVFRGAWLDHRVKEGLLEVAWDDEAADFGYRDPHGGRAAARARARAELARAAVPPLGAIRLRGCSARSRSPSLRRSSARRRLTVRTPGGTAARGRRTVRGWPQGTRLGLITVAADGGDPRLLGGGDDPAWSPDGTLLVVTDQFGRANFLGLQVVTVGGRSSPLTRNPAPTAELLIDQTQPDWQPVR